MKLEFKETAFQDFKYWVKNDKRKALRIIELLSDIENNPFQGIGKPEPLKFHLKGFWSRRIDLEHRLVYSVDKNTIVIFSCRYHYK
jgi:toxin YoeB